MGAGLLDNISIHILETHISEGAIPSRVEMEG
jgi:hypothetical protein